MENTFDLKYISGAKKYAHYLTQSRLQCHMASKFKGLKMSIQKAYFGVVLPCIQEENFNFFVCFSLTLYG